MSREYRLVSTSLGLRLQGTAPDGVFYDLPADPAYLEHLRRESGAPPIPLHRCEAVCGNFAADALEECLGRLQWEQEKLRALGCTLTAAFIRADQAADRRVPA